MSERNKKTMAEFNKKTFTKKNSIQEEQYRKIKPKLSNHNTKLSSPKNKRSNSQLEVAKSFQSNLDSSVSRSSSRHSLTIKPSSTDNEGDELASTFQNMFNQFSRLSQIMSSNIHQQPDSLKKKSSCSTLRTPRRTNEIESYKPLSNEEKMMFLEEISKGSELRMNAYNTIFNAIKSQLSLLSVDQEESVYETHCSKGRNKNNVLFNNATTVDSNKNVNIINNNITVNIINTESSTVPTDTSLTQKEERKVVKKDSGKGNFSLTYNDDILDDESKNSVKNIVVKSSALKNKIDLEKSSPFSSRKSSTKLVNTKVIKKLELNFISMEENIQEPDTSNKTLSLKTNFFDAKNELNSIKQTKTDKSDQASMSSRTANEEKIKNCLII